MIFYVFFLYSSYLSFLNSVIRELFDFLQQAHLEKGTLDTLRKKYGVWLLRRTGIKRTWLVVTTSFNSNFAHKAACFSVFYCSVVHTRVCYARLALLPRWPDLSVSINISVAGSLSLGLWVSCKSGPLEKFILMCCSFVWEQLAYSTGQQSKVSNKTLNRSQTLESIPFV